MINSSDQNLDISSGQAEYNTGYFFFWKWQYYLRGEYLEDHMCRGNHEFLSVDEYIKQRQRKTDTRYIVNSTDLIVNYINGYYSLGDLLVMVPRWFRNKYYIFKYKFKDNILTVKLNEEIDISCNVSEYEQLKKCIIRELDDISNLIHEHTSSEFCLPEEFYSIGNEFYWKIASEIDCGLHRLRYNMVKRLMALWIWDCWIASPYQQYRRHTSELFNRFPALLAYEDNEEDEYYDAVVDSLGNINYERIGPRVNARVKNTYESIIKGQIVPM